MLNLITHCRGLVQGEGGYALFTATRAAPTYWQAGPIRTCDVEHRGSTVGKTPGFMVSIVIVLGPRVRHQVACHVHGFMAVHVNMDKYDDLHKLVQTVICVRTVLSCMRHSNVISLGI